MAATTYTIEIAPRFWDDHMDRDCVPALTSHKKGNRYVLTLDDEGMRDLYSDAIYYSDPGDLDPGFFGLSMSARSVVKAIRSKHPEWVAAYHASRRRPS